jgi:Ribonuclease HI
MAAICEYNARCYNGGTITIFTDSLPLESVTVKSKLVLECLGCLNELATHNSVQLVCVPGHEGILGNERVDELATKDADIP